MQQGTRSLTLVVTDLLSHGGAERLPSLPAIETALARAQARKVGGAIESIGRAFGLNRQDLHHIPYAGITRLADTGAWEPQGWLRADPVHLYADATRLLLFDPATLDVDMTEAGEFAARFEDMYAADGFRLETPVPARWYMQVPDVQTFCTTPLMNAIGTDLNTTMPTGADSRKLRALMNEVQMLFHDQPVNQSRAAAGRPVISGVWLWGEGTHVPPIPTHPDMVYAEDPWSRGLACLAGSDLADPPGDAQSWLNGSKDGSDLIVLDREAGRARPDAAARSTAAENLEAAWFAPLVAALQHGRLTQLLIYPGDRRCYRLTRAGLRRFWRRRRPLIKYVHQNS